MCYNIELKRDSMKASNIINIRESKVFNNNIKNDIRILSAGDFHINKYTKEDNINFYLDNVYKEDPNYICLLGDLIDNPLDINDCVDLLYKLVKNSSTIAPTFIILGNHDFIHKDSTIINKQIWDNINNIDNVCLLNDKLYKNDEIVIMGYTQKIEAYYNYNRDIVSDSDVFYNDFVKHDELYNVDNNLPKVALIHSPEYLTEERNIELLKNYDITICGHYHNGCVPPILDKLWNSDRGVINARRYLFPKNVRGILKLDNGNYLIYNGGWVKLSKSSAKELSFLDNLFNRQIDVTILTNDPECQNIKVKHKYIKKVFKNVAF